MNACSLCLNAEETVNHLLNHCNFASKVWGTILNRLGLHWVMTIIVQELFQQWRERARSRMVCQKKLWNLSIFAGVFCNICSGVEEIADSIVWSVSNWVSRIRILRKFLSKTFLS